MKKMESTRMAWMLGLLTLVGAGAAVASEPAPVGRIAAISGVHTPHQGFALSSIVPSDEMCLELAQNLASELGIVVHVICTDPSSGQATVVAECGYATSATADEVTSFSRTIGRSGERFLLCAPPDPDRFRATRVPPEVDRLGPQAR